MSAILVKTSACFLIMQTEVIVGCGRSCITYIVHFLHRYPDFPCAVKFMVQAHLPSPPPLYITSVLKWGEGAFAPNSTEFVVVSTHGVFSAHNYDAKTVEQSAKIVVQGRCGFSK